MFEGHFLVIDNVNNYYLCYQLTTLLLLSRKPFNERALPT